MEKAVGAVRKLCNFIHRWMVKVCKYSVVFNMLKYFPVIASPGGAVTLHSIHRIALLPFTIKTSSLKPFDTVGISHFPPAAQLSKHFYVSQWK